MLNCPCVSLICSDCFPFFFSLILLTHLPKAKAARRLVIGYRGLHRISATMLMLGPKSNPTLSNPLLSALKRKNVTSKILTRRTKKKINPMVVNIPDMDGTLACAFDVLAFFSFFSSFCALTDHLVFHLVFGFDRSINANHYGWF